MKKTSFVMLLLVFMIGIFAYAALAEESSFDFTAFAKTAVLTDFHPTAKPSKAVAEYDEQPYEREPGIIRARVHMYYEGWIRKHEMLVEIDLKKADRTVKVAVLRDSNGMNLLGNSTFKENQWVSLASIGWK